MKYHKMDRIRLRLEYRYIFSGDVGDGWNICNDGKMVGIKVILNGNASFEYKLNHFNRKRRIINEWKAEFIDCDWMGVTDEGI